MSQSKLLPAFDLQGKGLAVQGKLPAAKKPRVTGVVFVLLGLVLGGLGAVLALGGGSLYYITAGVYLTYIGVSLFRGQPAAALHYVVFWVLTLVWSLYEVGFSVWDLLPRMALFTALLLLFVLPWYQRRLQTFNPRPVYMALLAAMAVLLISIGQYGRYDIDEPSAAGSGLQPSQMRAWQQYGATGKGTRYAPAQQINAQNVAQLEHAWTFRTGVAGRFQGTPLQVDNDLFLCAAGNVIFALDADSGKQKWRFDPQVKGADFSFAQNCRGVSYYDAGPADHDTVCAQRIYTATTDARLIALDRRSGRPCPDFGNNGEVDLSAGMGEFEPAFYFVTSPAAVGDGKLVLGGWVLDNYATEEPSGVVRAFDALTGELAWAWDMGREGEGNRLAEGESYTRGTPNVWSLISVDEELGLVYLPTGNATPDYFGGHRSPVMDKYASSVVALNLSDGSVAWHFQTTHHDIWDYDVPSQPTLTDVPIDGVQRKAVVVPTKRSELFLLDRVTGQPLAEVTEKSVPQTDVAMETTLPTQPFSTGMPSFLHRDKLLEKDMWGITPFDHLACRIQFNKLRYEGPLTPPSLQGTLYYPGVAGGQNWGSVAVDEVNHLMVVNTLHMPFVVTLIPREETQDQGSYVVGGPQLGTPYAARSTPFLSPLFAPCLRPPYGEIAVVDLASQRTLWRRPLGTAAKYGPLGLSTGIPFPMGMFYSAGTVVTGGGLIFMGGVADDTMRALDLFTGEQLWSKALPNTAQATPMSYVSPVTGKQYVVVTVPDDAVDSLEMDKSATAEDDGQRGGYVIAYTLPADE